jgi:hypothetical protein
MSNTLEYYGKMNSFLIEFSDGNKLMTSMNADLDGAKSYYVGNEFNMGVDDDKIVTGTRVTQLNGGA